MQTITNEYEKSRNSVLDLNDKYFELFYVNIVEVPLLEKTLEERASKNAYYPTLYRDIWFMIEQPFHEVRFNKKVDFSNEVLSLLLQSIYDHPTFQIIHDLSHDKEGNSFVSALLLTEVITMVIDSELNELFNPNGTKKDTNLNEFINTQLELGNCLEYAAQSILFTLKELPIFYDMNAFTSLPLPEKTTRSLVVFNEMSLMEEVTLNKEIYM